MRNVQKANTVAPMAATFGKHEPLDPLFTVSTSGSCLEDKACDYDTGICWDENTEEEKKNCAAGKFQSRAL